MTIMANALCVFLMGQSPGSRSTCALLGNHLTILSQQKGFITITAILIKNWAWSV